MTWLSTSIEGSGSEWIPEMTDFSSFSDDLKRLWYNENIYHISPQTLFNTLERLFIHRPNPSHTIIISERIDAMFLIAIRNQYFAPQASLGWRSFIEETVLREINLPVIHCHLNLNTPLSLEDWTTALWKIKELQDGIDRIQRDTQYQVWDQIIPLVP